jgi:hypothetical protein
MKRKSSTLRPLIPVAALGLLSVGAQTFTPTKVVPVKPESANKLSASFRMAFNVKTSFENVGAFTSASTRTTPDGAAWNYDDGFVLVDASGNAMGYTRYWGYSSSGQLPGNGTILMNRSSSAGSSVSENPDAPIPGLEVTYRRELGRGDTFRWGLEAAANYMRVSVSDSRTISSSALSFTDAYALPGLEGGGYVTPPPAPYSHGSGLSPQGNPVIGATPISSLTETMMTSVSGSRDFDANVIGWRLGPYVEMPLGQRGRVSLSGGLSLAYILSDFNFNESIAGSSIGSISGGGSDSDLLVGAYISGEASYQLAQAWELFGAVQFQYLDKYSQTESGHTAVLDMTKSVFVSVGVSYSF